MGNRKTLLAVLAGIAIGVVAADKLRTLPVVSKLPTV